MDHRYDVVIIGAGPAGAVLAEELEERFRVLLIDKRCFRDPSRLYEQEKSCGGLLDKRAQKALAALKIPLHKDVLVSPQVFTLKGIDLDNKGMERYYQKQYVNIDRVKFDASLIQRAVKKKNVELWDETTAFGIYETEEGIRVKIRRQGQQTEVQTKFLVGADGGNSLVRRWLHQRGKSKKEPKRYVSLQEWYPVPEEPACFTAVFDRRVTDFYSWIIPENGQMIIGSALPGNKEAGRCFQQYKKDLEELGWDLSQPIKRRGAVICRPYPWRSICSGWNQIYLAGEAAGLISPCSCEGISYALNSGHLLAQTLNQNQGQSGYNRKLGKLKISIFLKSFKSPIMYGRCWRGLVFRSKLLSMKIYER